ncbi:MAG: ABC transporter ATP-binding protein [bacterium]|nr:ABC transporter ATP-binding protein [bacterium]MCM1375085.1 ABC transporter ATP-binding protein [Muribaculum sp.]
MSKAERVIEIEQMTKSYGKHRGVTDLSLSVEQGEIFGFLGPNGAGKSTTIRSMLGFIGFDRGSIRLFERDIRRHREEILAQIGYMPSEAMFYPTMKVKEVIRLAARVRGVDCDEEAAMLCERLQVDTEKRIRELSLGNRKKVSIVCAMQHRPGLFVFDEPTSGLDPLMQTEFFRLIREYVERGATCMLSTHVLSEVKRYCDRVAIMKEGRLQSVESVTELTGAGAKRIKWIRDGVEEEFLYEKDLNELYRELMGHDIRELLIEEPPLEEVFIQYYRT